nr:RNA-dependent RNA polymerase [Marmot picobirnavirus]AVX53285.1 RNA-dependent RNA polymerase [Marmot picobirnavirus]
MNFKVSRAVREYVPTKEAQTSLRRYFKRVVAGQSEVYRSPFYKGKTTTEVLFDWNKRLGSVAREWPTLYSFEMDLAKKVGPMSVMQPLDKRLPDIDHYYDDIMDHQVPIDGLAINSLLSRLAPKESSLPSIRGQWETVANMRLSTNSGLPFFTRRSHVLNATVPCSSEIITDEVKVRLGARGVETKTAAVLGWRGQEGGPNPEDVKQRVIWMFPFSVNVQELQVYQPLIEYFQNYLKYAPWIGVDAVDSEITALFDTKQSNQLVICTDFTRFDQHFNPVCQAAAKQILQKLLKGPTAAEWLEEVFPIKYMIPLMYNYGEVRTGAHGMASGSGGTNFDETIVHMALQFESALQHGALLNPHSMCLGDDGVLTYPGITVEDVVSTYSKHGLEMNTDKQYASTDDCVFLRRWHHNNYRDDGVCVGVYSTMRALGRLMMQERYYDPDLWGPKMVALRQLSIIENVKWHPLRNEFAEFCMKGDRYRLGIDIPGFLANIQSEADKAIEHMPEFMSYAQAQGADRNPIDSWWIVNYLRRRARHRR